MNRSARIPLTVAARIPRGIHRISRAINRWRTDTKNQPAYERALEAAPARYMQLRQDREQRRKQRTGLLIIAFCLTAIAVLLADEFVGAWTWQAAAAVLFVTVIAAGNDRSPNHTKNNATAKKNASITVEAVTDALASAVPEVRAAIKNDPDAVFYPDPPAREGAGWTIRAELPAGVTAGMVAIQQPKMASAFRRPTLAVTVDPDPAHAGMVSVWVGDSIPSDDVEWRYTNKPERIDILEPFVIGEDIPGRPVTVSLRNQNILLGAQPGYGKTATLRLILLAAILDPRTKVYAYDLKGGVDLLPLEDAAERIVSGDEPEDLEQLRDDLQEVQKEISARNRMLRHLPIADRPDGQITTKDATRLGLRPLVFAIDEAQIAYADETYGKEIRKLTEDIFRRGRSVGIHMALATQRFDTESVPRNISTNASLRMCGRVDSFQESNMVLGSNAHGAGQSATIFGPDDRGVMWMKGFGKPTIVRVARVTSTDAWAITEQAVKFRNEHVLEPAPVLPALLPPRPRPRPDLPPAHDLPARVRHVWPDGEDKLWSETILGLLRETFHGEYADMTTVELSRKLPGKPRQVWKNNKNRQGYALTDFAPADSLGVPSSAPSDV